MQGLKLVVYGPLDQTRQCLGYRPVIGGQALLLGGTIAQKVTMPGCAAKNLAPGGHFKAFSERFTSFGHVKTAKRTQQR